MLWSVTILLVAALLYIGGSYRLGKWMFDRSWDLWWGMRIVVVGGLILFVALWGWRIPIPANLTDADLSSWWGWMLGYVIVTVVLGGGLFIRGTGVAEDEYANTFS
jgi:hypothetical protein